MDVLQNLLDELVSGDEILAEFAVKKLPALADSAFFALQKLLDSPDTDVRWWALRALSEFDLPQISSILTKYLTDPDPAVQSCAVLGLRLHPSSQAVPELVTLLSTKDQLLARLVSDALIATGKDATEALILFLENGLSNPQIARLETVRALAKIQDPLAIPTLFKAWETGSGMMQYWAEEGLNALGIGMVFFDPE